VNGPRISPVVACDWTLVCCAGVILFGSLPELAAFALCYLCLAVSGSRSLAALRLAVGFTLPFALPLLAVHGILNANFAVSARLFGGVPIRSAGMDYALVISLRILVLSCAAVIWRFVDPDRLMRESVHLGFPRSVVVMLAVALATMRMVPNRIRAVYLAQQARGLPSGPGLGARVRAFPSVVVPVVVSTLLEGASRGEMMATRGLGSCAFKMALLAPVVAVGDVAQVLLGFLALIAPFLVWP